MQHGNWKCEIQSIQKKMHSMGVANWAKESGKSGEGKRQIGHMQFDRGNKYEI